MKNCHLIPTVWLLALASSLPCFANPTTPRPKTQAAAEAKPYVLFMGADYFVERQGKLCPVKGFNKKGFVIDMDGRRVAVSADREDLNFQAHQALKVAATGVAISDFKVERAYTQAADPKRAWDTAVRSAAGMSAKMDSERYHADLQIAQIGYMEAAPQMPNAPDPKQNLPQVQGQYSNTQATILADQGPAMQAVSSAPASGAGRAGDSHDAFQLSFDITSRTPTSGVYMMLAVRTREPTDKANPEAIWIIGDDIGDIGPRAKTVRMFRGGFPPGYELTAVQAHFYRDGTEIATNLAPMHVEITGDEAFRIALVDYIGHHRNADVQPVRASSGLPDSVRARIGADQLNRTYYVKVGKNGHPAGAFLDEACTRQVTDEPLASAFAAMRFFPALKSGQPVDAVAAVRL